MQSQETIRRWNIDQLRHTVNVLTYMVGTIPAVDLRTRRDGDDGWTALEVLGHLHDYDKLFIERATLTLEQDNPPLPNPDPNELAARHDYNGAEPAELLAGWTDARDELIALYEGATEAQFARVSQHPRRGPFTLQDQLFLTVWHDMNHIDQIAKIMLGGA
jgi:uncharacterized damage-inducible protein DinB